MARLSARGRTELVRVSKAEDVTDSDSVVTWRRYTKALMSDGTILEKVDVRFKSDGSRHSYGWKAKGKAKKGLTAEQFVEVFAKAGYTKEV